MTAQARPDADRARPWRQRIVLGGLCVAVAVALVFNYYKYWAKQPPQAKTRTIYDFYTTWRCVECGHQLDDRGAEGTRPCPKCEVGEMYVCIPHGCPEHGTFPVYFLYDDQSEHGDPSRIRVADGEWSSYLDDDYNINIRCPRCRRDLRPAQLSRPAPPVDESRLP